MLETFVPSKIRRTLLEHLLTHPTDRFYLRGLAKTLLLPMSPLRRELKRLEQAGMLCSVQEGNMLFYTIHQASAAFRQLQGATSATQPAAPARSLEQPTAPSALLQAQLEVPGSSFVVRGSRTTNHDSRMTNWTSPLRTPALIAAAGVGVTVMLIIAGLGYVTMTNQRLVSQVSRTLSPGRAAVAVVASPPSASGTMRGARWQVVPGGMGGFSSSANSESF